MTDEAQTTVEAIVDPAAVAQGEPAADPAPEAAPVAEVAPEAAQEAPEAPEVEAVPDEAAETPEVAAVPDADDDEIDEAVAEAAAPVHNPNALRGIQAGPDPHPRTV